jgi:hypothetical protein
MMRQSNTLLAVSDRIYRLLLIAYPDAFRRQYGAEMAQVFYDSCRDAIAREGAVGIAEVWLRTIGDLIVSALKERAAAPDKRHQALKYAGERRSNMPLFSKPERMKTKLDTFTKRARNALQLATEESRALNHAYIGTEHLLLGLIRERKGVSGEVLHSLGVSLDQARRATQSLMGLGKQPALEAQPLTKRAVQAIDRALEEARQLNHRFVGTEHLLLGIIETSDGAAVGVLDRLGMPADRVRAEVLRVLGQAEHR